MYLEKNNVPSTDRELEEGKCKHRWDKTLSTIDKYYNGNVEKIFNEQNE